MQRCLTTFALRRHTSFPSQLSNAPRLYVLRQKKRFTMAAANASTTSVTTANKEEARLKVPFDRTTMERVLRSRFFYTQAYALYGGVAGLFDLGPPACAIQANIINEWRKHFVIEEDMLELDTTILTPHDVLKTSGHVDKFTDLMVRDKVTGDFHRADHLVEGAIERRIEAHHEALANPNAKPKKGKEVVALSSEQLAAFQSILAQIDGFNAQDLERLIREYDLRAPETNNEVTSPEPFNLMFPTSIGPSGNLKAYLRPETAQGQFLNFNKMLEFNAQTMPFASAQIGRSFRNEISPRSGLLRVREFTMAEIEHYVHPDEKQHPGFKEVAGHQLNLLSSPTQESGSADITVMSIGDAVAKGMVNNETLGYFMARIQAFLLKIGISKDRLRFRQHMSNEMAHYASDCWDAEIHTSYGWIECVGCADRSAYDLTAHSNKTGEKLTVQRALASPVTKDVTKVEINRKKFGPTFKKDAKAIETHLFQLPRDALQKLNAQLNSESNVKMEVDGQSFDLNLDLLTIRDVQETSHVEEYTPHVIEPSFGIGRILYALLEHSFWVRPEDEQRTVFSFRPVVAPIKVLIVPLSKGAAFPPFVADIAKKLRSRGVPNRVDDSSTAIGRRYARNDELGTPFGVTIDFQTPQDQTVTLRERDSTKQIRQKVEVIIDIIVDLVEERYTWDDVLAKYPLFEGQVLQ